MKSKPKTHTRLKKSSSKFFKKSNRKSKGTRDNSIDATAKLDLDRNQKIDVRLVLKNVFGQKVIGRLKKLPNAPIGIGPKEAFNLVLTLIDSVINRHNIDIKEVNERTRIITLTGKIIDFERLFQVTLAYYKYESFIQNFAHTKTVLGHHGSLYIPREWKGMIDSVIGLRNAPLHPLAVSPTAFAEGPSVPAALGKSPDQVAQHYNFPKNTDGAGQHIGIITCGGGFSQEEFDSYFNELGLPKMEPIKVVSIDGVENNPNSPWAYSWIYDYEIATDCLVTCCAAPGARITVYFCQNHLSSFLNAIKHIIDEEEDGPGIISYSWGSGEENCENSMEGVNRILKEAALDYNKSIFCATGDFGSTNMPNLSIADLDETDKLEVLFPASSPWVTSCGGTMFEDKEGGEKGDETVWNCKFLYNVLAQNATGGGFSKYFLRPDYQMNIVEDIVPSGYINPKWIKGIKNPEMQQKALIRKFKPFRGVPDVAGYAAVPPAGIGYWVYFQEKNWMAGGTSAVAPLWAALTARLNQSLGRKVGFFNPVLYAMGGTNVFRPVLNGHNGLMETNTHWEAAEPWNPCTGLGLPDGENMLNWLKNKHAEEQEKSKKRAPNR